MNFCTDTDLLHWEPNLFRDAVFASQLLLGGTGDLAGTTFTLTSGSLNDAHVAAGNVLVLSGASPGSYPILSVDSDTELTISVLYDGFFDEDGEPQPSHVGTATAVPFAVRTFSPQARVVGELLKQAAGIVPGSVDPQSLTILNSESLRRPCVLGTLQMIYNALATAAAQPEELALRADLYERLYRRAMRGARVELDTDGDGKANIVRPLNVLSLRRA